MPADTGHVQADIAYIVSMITTNFFVLVINTLVLLMFWRFRWKLLVKGDKNFFLLSMSVADFFCWNHWYSCGHSFSLTKDEIVDINIQQNVWDASIFMQFLRVNIFVGSKDSGKTIFSKISFTSFGCHERKENKVPYRSCLVNSHINIINNSGSTVPRTVPENITVT